MKKPSFLVEREGIHAVGSIISKMGWVFREQPTTDFGIDAQVEIVEDGKPTGALIALQIKSGDSFFRTGKSDAINFTGELRHLDYWNSHSLPVYLVIHNPKTEQTLWQRIERRLCHVTERSWSIDIPYNQTLDERAKPFLSRGIASDDEAYRRFVFAMDAKFMEKFEDQSDALLVWEDWINKGLGLRNPKFIFDDGEEIVSQNYYPTHNIPYAMDRLYPWLFFEETEEPEEVAGEVEVHTLSISLRPEAQAYLQAERFFREGPSPNEDDNLAWSEEDSLPDADWGDS